MQVDLSKAPYINRAFRIVYLAHPRTASHATALAITEQAGFQKNGVQHHATLRERAPAEWVVVTAVRNHFDALVSWYFFRYWRNLKFGIEFVKFLIAEHPYYFPLGGQLWGLHLPVSTHLIRWETIDRDLNAVLAGCGLDAVRIPKHNVTESRKPYQEYYTDDSRSFVEEMFSGEMEALGYSWEGVGQGEQK